MLQWQVSFYATCSGNGDQKSMLNMMVLLGGREGSEHSIGTSFSRTASLQCRPAVIESEVEKRKINKL